MLDLLAYALEESGGGEDVVDGPEGAGGYVGERGLDVEDVEAGDVGLRDAVLLAGVNEGFEEPGCTVRVSIVVEIVFNGAGAGQSTPVAGGCCDGGKNIEKEFGEILVEIPVLRCFSISVHLKSKNRFCLPETVTYVAGAERVHGSIDRISRCERQFISKPCHEMHFALLGLAIELLTGLEKAVQHGLDDMVELRVSRCQRGLHGFHAVLEQAPLPALAFNIMEPDRLGLFAEIHHPGGILGCKRRRAEGLGVALDGHYQIRRVDDIHPSSWHGETVGRQRVLCTTESH